MATVSETIPEALQPEVDAALSWFNAQHPDEFEVTGILDPDLTLESEAPRELNLVLCGGDTCQQRSFRVSNDGVSFEIAFSGRDLDAHSSSGEAQSDLDPPPGHRRKWLDSVLARHKFVVLVFYRGFW